MSLKERGSGQVGAGQGRDGQFWSPWRDWRKGSPGLRGLCCLPASTHAALTPAPVGDRDVAGAEALCPMALVPAGGLHASSTHVHISGSLVTLQQKPWLGVDIVVG